MDNKYIVIIKNGAVREAKTKEELLFQKQSFEKLQSGKLTDKETDTINKAYFAKLGVDVYIANQEKDSVEFMAHTKDAVKAQTFATKAQAQAIAKYLVDVNKSNGKKFDVVVGTLEIKIKELK